MSTFQIIIVAICFVLNMNDGIDVLVVSFSGSDITKEWGLSKTEMGYVFSAGLAGMMAGAFLLAPLGDKIGRRKVFLIALTFITSGMLLVFFCTSYMQLLLLRFLTGLGIGGILPTMAATASEFSNNKNRDFNVGLVQAMSWVPNIAKEAGLPFEMATYVGISLNVGAAIGTASIGWVAGRLGLKKTVLSFMILAFAVMLIYGNFTLNTTMIFVMIFFIGIFVQGGFNGIYPTISRVYPTEIRTTGVGFSIGIGRMGAILGPTLFGVLSDAGLSIQLLFSLFSLPLLVTGLAVYSLRSKNLS